MAAVSLGLVGGLGMTGCTINLTSPTGSSTAASVSIAPGFDSTTSIIQRFINAVNAGKQAQAYDLFCPLNAANAAAALQEAVASSATLEIDSSIPPKVLTTQTEFGITGTMAGSRAKGSIISQVQDGGETCIMHFYVYKAS